MCVCVHLDTQPPPYSVATARSTTLPVRISAPLARPQTRYQTRVEQEKAEHERVQAISKVGGARMSFLIKGAVPYILEGDFPLPFSKKF